MKRSDAFPSKYMSKDDLPSPRIAVISHVTKESIKGDNGEEDKAVLYFEGKDKPMILNNINWMTIESEYGDESDDWTGKRIELYVDPNIMFGNKRVGGVRIRIPQSSMNGHMTWPDAVIQCAKVGVEEGALKERLKNAGIASVRDAEFKKTVEDIIRNARGESPFEGETAAAFKDDDIPF